MKPNLCCALNKGGKCPSCKLSFCTVCLSNGEHIQRKTWTLGVCVNTGQYVEIDGLKIVNVLTADALEETEEDSNV